MLPFLGILGLRFYGVPRIVEYYILNKLRPVLGANAQLESVDLSFNSLRLLGLSFKVPQSGIQVSAREVRLNLQFINLLLYVPSAVNLVEEVQVEDWRVSLGGLDKGSMKADSAMPLWEIIKQYPTVKRMNFRRGTVSYPPFILDNIQGWVDLSKSDSVKYDFSARVFSDTSNFRLRGSLNALNETAQADINLNAARIPADLEYAAARFSGGEINIAMEGSLTGGGIRLKGSAEAAGVDFTLSDKWDFRGISVKSRMQDTTIWIDGSGKFMGQGAVAQGKIQGLKKPEFNLWFETPQMDIEPALLVLFPLIKVCGQCRAEVMLKGPAAEPLLDFRVSSTSVFFNNSEFNDIQFSGDIKKKAARLDSFRFLAGGGEIEGKGRILLDEKGGGLDLSSHFLGKPSLEGFFPEAGPLPVEALELFANIRGTALNPAVDGSYSLIVSPALKELRGDFSYHNQKVSFTENSGAGDSLKISVDFSLGEPKFTVFGDNPHLILSQNILPGFLSGSRFSTGIGAAGTLDNFNFSLKADWPGIRFTLSSKLLLGEAVRSLCSYTVVIDDSVRFGGDIALRMLADTLILDNFTLADYVYAWGEFDIQNRQVRAFNFRTDELPLDTTLLCIGYEKWRDYKGKVKLDIAAKGRLDSLNAELNCYLSGLELFGTPGYWANIAGSLNDRKFSLLGMDFGSGGKRLFSGTGAYDFSSRNFSFNSSMHSVDSDLLLNSLTGKKGIISGNCSYDIRATGLLEQPLVEADIHIENGRLLKIPFDELDAALKFEQKAGNQGKITVSSLRLREKDIFSIGVIGEVPLNQENMQLKFDAQGRLPKILPALEKIFIDADGIGKAEAILDGTLKAPRLLSASITISDGMLKLREVADRIDNIKLEASLEDDFIHIKNLSGNVDGAPFTITTIPSVVTSDGRLEPWIIGDSGISLGIITLTTGREGVKLNLPSFVKPGETAKLEPLGKSPGETAYIAGPEAHPVVRGRLIVRDGILIYPPYKKKSEAAVNGQPPEQKPVTKLLEKINWDLEVIPERGNTYSREMSGFMGAGFFENFPIVFDRVVVDLNMDRQVEGLLLKGSHADGSFTIDGKLSSTRGTIEFLDLDFNVREFNVEFDPAQELPVVDGYATTTYRDSLDRNLNVTLRVAHEDMETGIVNYQARWGDFTFVLEDELGDSQEQILGYFGYAPETIGGRMTDISFRALNQAVFGDWLRTLSREIRNVLGLDYLNINPAVAQNLLEERLSTPVGADTLSVDWRARYFRRSKFTVGKYISDDLFFTYSGRFETGIPAYEEDPRLGIIHSWNLEYRIPAKGANLLFILSYEYDNLARREDRSLSVRYFFNF